MVMEFTLVSSANLTFKNEGKSKDKTMTAKLSNVRVDKLEGARSTSSKAHFLAKLEGLLLAQPSRGGKRQRLSQPMDSRLEVRIFHGALSPSVAPARKQTGCVVIDDLDESDGLFKRLVGVCGGHKNIQAHLILEFGTVEDKMKLNFNFKDLTLLQSDQNTFLCGKYFDFTERLSQAWSTPAKFTGTLSLSLRLNCEALSLVHGGNLDMSDLINRKLLENAAESGDGIIVVGNGKEFPCHKAILSAHSAVFRAMFNSDMKEGKSSRVTMPDMSETGINAMLAYLYCCDIQKALSSSFTSVELLRAADKYGIDKLYETMKDLILDMENDWLTLDAAVQLLTLAKNRADSADFKELGKKAKLIIKVKPLIELKECAEFREMFDNSDNGMETWSYFIQEQ